MLSKRIKLHRYSSWALAIASFAVISTGYILSRGWLSDFLFVSSLHRISEVFFVGLLVVHIVYTLFYSKLDLRKTIARIGWGKKNSIHMMRVAQRVSSWFIVATAGVMVLTGLNGYVSFAQLFGEFVPFSPHRVVDLLLVLSIGIHVSIGVRFALMRKRVRSSIARYASAVTGVSLVLIAFLLNPATMPTLPDNGNNTPSLNADVYIDGNRLSFNPEEVESIRPDIFRSGSFSMFDVLVHLSELGGVDLVYHLNESMNTHVIDSLNGEPYWWYEVVYSGGWSESNVYRMDHYLWKPDTSLSFAIVGKNKIDAIYETYVEEIERLQDNGGQVVIPTITIDGVYEDLEFSNLTVTPHNLRNGTFQDGVVTAIDVIMSLGDLGLANYTIKWYDSLGRAQVVRNYWVESINSDVASGTCGFVYDCGSLRYYGFAGNHIHLPMDVRVLNSPEYLRMFWICL